MSSTLALAIWMALLLALLKYDPAADRRLSPALWLPVLWFALLGSRTPAQWLSGSIGYSASGLLEGNPVDHVVYLTLIVASILILKSRAFDWRRFFRANVWLTGLLVFSLASIAWSDYPFVTFKRWFRDLGVYLAVLVILSGGAPFDSVRCVLRRVFYLLIPLSVVFVKYLPYLGRSFDYWSGRGYFVGVATSKNMLGVLCMVSALYFIWDTTVRWPQRRDGRERAVLLVNVCFVGMSLWLLSIVDSATSTLCFALGATILALGIAPPLRNRPMLVVSLVPCAIASYVLLQFVFGIDLIAVVSQLVGRTPDLTGRKEIWEVVLSAGTNPLVGVGYNSFWLGSRLEWVWARTVGVNVAHNGYLEVYLSLGAIGLALLVGFLWASYIKCARQFKEAPVIGSFGIAIWAILIFYNFTESSFSVNVLWLTFLTMAITLIEPTVIGAKSGQVHNVRGIDEPRSKSSRLGGSASAHRFHLPRPNGRKMSRRPRRF